MKAAFPKPLCGNRTGAFHWGRPCHKAVERFPLHSTEKAIDYTSGNPELGFPLHSTGKAAVMPHLWPMCGVFPAVRGKLLALHVGKRNPMVLIVPGGDVAPGSKNSSQYGEDCPGSRLPIRSGGSSPHGEHAVFPGFPPVGSMTEALPVIPLELQERKHQPPAVVRPWEKGGSHPLAKAAGL